MRVLCGDGIERDAQQLASARTHREAYPEQYTHELVGKRVARGNDLLGVVQRVVNTKHGPLAQCESSPNHFYPIAGLSVVQ